VLVPPTECALEPFVPVDGYITFTGTDALGVLTVEPNTSTGAELDGTGACTAKSGDTVSVSGTN
jgi:hypothetical protein